MGLRFLLEQQQVDVLHELGEALDDAASARLERVAVYGRRTSCVTSVIRLLCSVIGGANAFL